MKRAKLRWSMEALRNLQEILSYIEKDSPERAAGFGKKVLAGVQRLESFPSSGRWVPELDDQRPPPREIIIGEHRVIYRLNSGIVEIVTIVHGKRLLHFHQA